MRKTGTETLGILRLAYAKESLPFAQVFLWHKVFKYGRERTGCTSSSTSGHPDKRLKEVLVSELSPILLECATFVLKVLTTDQENIRVSISHGVTDLLTSGPNLLRVTIGDDTLVFEYDPVTKVLSLEWQTDVTATKGREKSKVKNMLIVEESPQGANAGFYAQEVNRMRKKVAHVGPEIKHS